jgi:multicomponent Na+:H+ antiporter subunit C
VAETPIFAAEDAAAIPVDTSVFPHTLLGPDGTGVTVSPAGDAADGDSAGSDSSATVKAGAKTIPAEDAALEEKPGSANVHPGPEGGVK